MVGNDPGGCGTGRHCAGGPDRPRRRVIYDTTWTSWLADWNYARTSGFDADGSMNWTTAKAGPITWSRRLQRLAALVTECQRGSGPCGPAFNTGGGWAYSTSTGRHRKTAFVRTNAANLALFSNVVSFIYWSGTEYAPNQSEAWFFNVTQGARPTSPNRQDCLPWLCARRCDPRRCRERSRSPRAAGVGRRMVARRRRPR
jgi:hypothetical protein